MFIPTVNLLIDTVFGVLVLALGCLDQAVLRLIKAQTVHHQNLMFVVAAQWGP